MRLSKGAGDSDSFVKLHCNLIKVSFAEIGNFALGCNRLDRARFIMRDPSLRIPFWNYTVI